MTTNAPTSFLTLRYDVTARRTAETPARCEVPGGPSYRVVGRGLTFAGMMAEVERLEIAACDVRVTDELGRRVSPTALMRCITGNAPLSELMAESEARAVARGEAMRHADRAERSAREAFAQGDEHGGRTSLAVASAHRKTAAELRGA